MSYFPLDRDVLTSSLWAEGSPEAIKVWIYLLLQAKPGTGIVEDAAPAIALRCGLPLAVTLEALAWLAAPDKHSRTKAHDGRRVEALSEGGFRLLNYVRRRDKDHSTVRVRRYRERKRSETVGNGRETVSETTNTNTETTDVRMTAFVRPSGPANPLVSGRRPELERECLALVREVAGLTGEDPVEVIAQASGYKGAATTKLNPATMSDDRLANTVRDLRADLAELRKKHDQTAQR